MSEKRQFDRAVRVLQAALKLVVVASLSSCAGDGEETASPTVPIAAEIGDPSSWVASYDPSRAWSGYTLAFYKQRLPILMDMNGRIVHSWPQARLKSRMRLLPDGSLLGIGLSRSILEYDWNGRLMSEHSLGSRIPHHDLIRLANGNTMVVVRTSGSATDDLLELDPAGRTVWEWHSAEHLRSYFGDGEELRGDITHINSIQELPDNTWYRRGDERFRPGNLLLSARNLDRIFLLERRSGEVVWTFGEGLDRQHEALMVEPGMKRHGNILIFNNGYQNRYEYRQSTVLEIDPGRQSVVWEYRADGFYSPTGGVEQPLPNGNVLISSSRGGRALEVTREGDTVWEWIPPFEPRRPRRYSHDHCPQLEAMGRAQERSVEPEPGRRHIDGDVYRFSRRGERVKVRAGGRQREVLLRNDHCSKVLLPAEAQLHLAYGLYRERIVRSGRRRFPVCFAMRLQPEQGGESIELFREKVGLKRPTSRSRTVDLSPFAYRWVTLCTEAVPLRPTAGEPSERVAYWGEPTIRVGAGESASSAAEESFRRDLTAEELQVQEEHLRALGYID